MLFTKSNRNSIPLGLCQAWAFNLLANLTRKNTHTHIHTPRRMNERFFHRILQFTQFVQSNEDAHDTQPDSMFLWFPLNFSKDTNETKYERKDTLHIYSKLRAQQQKKNNENIFTYHALTQSHSHTCDTEWMKSILLIWIPDCQKYLGI